MSQSTRIGALIGPLPAGQGYAITLTADSVEGTSNCSGSVVDASGYTGAFAGTPTVLVVAAANTAFRGVALAPAP